MSSSILGSSRASFNHAGLYIGGEKEQTIHAISDGIVCEDILNFLRTDHLVVLRPPADLVPAAIEKAHKIVGKEYDFSFDFLRHDRFSCTEVIDYCYPNLIKRRKKWGKQIIVADDILACPSFKIVWDSRKT